MPKRELTLEEELIYKRISSPRARKSNYTYKISYFINSDQKRAKNGYYWTLVGVQRLMDKIKPERFLVTYKKSIDCEVIAAVQNWKLN